MSDARHVRRSGQAIAKSAGLAFGSAQKLNQKHQFIQEYTIGHDEVEAEIGKLKQAVARASAKLRQEVQDLARVDISEELTLILQAHDMMLNDPDLFDKTVAFIRRDHINAAWGLKKSLSLITRAFEDVEDEYLRSRKADVEHVGSRIFEQLLGEADKPEYAQAIMVAEDFSPMDMVDMWRAGVSGFVSIQGGENSHAMIVARGVGLTGIAGVQGLFEYLEDGLPLMVDAERGRWILCPDAADIQQFQQAKEALEQQHQALKHYIHRPSVTQDGYHLPLMANAEFLEELDVVRAQGADGIGLFRTEFLCLQDGKPVDEDAQYASYCRVFQAMQDKPVTFRLLDIAADKLGKVSAPDAVWGGDNPALGLRGVRLLLQNRAWLKQQLRALLRAAEGKALSILVPMVSQPSEMQAVRKVLDDVCAELPGTHQVSLGCMIEVPAAALIAEDLADVSDFFSIGSNDLVQYCLAVDRTDEHVSYLYDANHPAVCRLIQMSVDAAHLRHIPVSICGELASSPAWLHTFLTMRVSSLSMAAQHILPMRRKLNQARAGA